MEEIERNPNVLLYGSDSKAKEFLSQFYEFKRSEELNGNVSTPDTDEDEVPLSNLAKKKTVLKRKRKSSVSKEESKDATDEKEEQNDTLNTANKFEAKREDGETVATTTASLWSVEADSGSETGRIPGQDECGWFDAGSLAANGADGAPRLSRIARHEAEAGGHQLHAGINRMNRISICL
ncbi:hypothetical protein Ciccas_010966 [Cichlidogyrus casuarinus]|uniref:Uncharacterized protein n=1 Tax=Cichlidogyrus casuarinus TaxID=1844966 RepID=A0ABD2PSL8_9PLAT